MLLFDYNCRLDTIYTIVISGYQGKLALIMAWFVIFTIRPMEVLHLLKLYALHSESPRLQFAYSLWVFVLVNDNFSSGISDHRSRMRIIVHERYSFGRGNFWRCLWFLFKNVSLRTIENRHLSVTYNILDFCVFKTSGEGSRLWDRWRWHATRLRRSPLHRGNAVRLWRVACFHGNVNAKKTINDITVLHDRRVDPI